LAEIAFEESIHEKNFVSSIFSMDSSALQTSGVSIGGVAILAILYQVYKAVNHHRIRSKCCGRQLDASIDIDTTPATPLPEKDGEKSRDKKTTTSPIVVVQKRESEAGTSEV